MTHDRVRDGADVVEADGVASTGQGARLAGEHEILRGANAGAERDPLLDRLRATWALGAAGAHQRERVAHHRIGHRHPAHQPLERDEIRTAHRLLELRLEDRGRCLDDHEFLVLGRCSMTMWNMKRSSWA